MNDIVGFFDTLADRWDELCHHDPAKIQYILNQTHLRKGSRILDVGCGTGILESFLLPYAPSRIVGVDIAPRMIRRAQYKYATNLVEFRCLDVMDLHDERFDIIFAYSVFPHFGNPTKLIAHLASLLEPEGELVICHSESKEQINGHHTKHAGLLSFSLPPARELATWMEPYFQIAALEDNEQLYLVKGVRRK